MSGTAFQKTGTCKLPVTRPDIVTKAMLCYDRNLEPGTHSLNIEQYANRAAPPIRIQQVTQALEKLRPSRRAPQA